MEPVPYEIREDDVYEVLGAYGAAENRDDAVRHVMARVRDINEIVRTAPETPRDEGRLHRDILEPEAARPGDQSDARRDLALAAIEDVLITGGFVEAAAEARVFS